MADTPSEMVTMAGLGQTWVARQRIPTSEKQHLCITILETTLANIMNLIIGLITVLPDAVSQTCACSSCQEI